MKKYRFGLIALSLIVLIAVAISCRNKKTKEITPDRLLPIEGAYNVRDLGGYKTADGKRVKWQKVFRSGDLNHLTDTDLVCLNEIPIISFVDFRDSVEIATAPDKRPASLEHIFMLNINPGSISDLKEIQATNSGTILVEANKMLARDFQLAYKEFFRILMDEANIPLLFHCSAGKDRTGFAAALFLASLGVDHETIMQDYMLSAEYVKEKYAAMVEQYPPLAPVMTVKPEYLQAAFDVIDQEYGGMENYLTNCLEVDLNKMKAMYTE